MKKETYEEEIIEASQNEQEWKDLLKSFWDRQDKLAKGEEVEEEEDEF